MKLLSTLLIMSVLSTQAVAGIESLAVKRAAARAAEINAKKAAAISAKAVNQTKIPTKRELVAAMEGYVTPTYSSTNMFLGPTYTFGQEIGSIRTARGGAIKIQTGVRNSHEAEQQIIFSVTNQQDKHLINGIMYEQPMGVTQTGTTYAINISSLTKAQIFPGMRYGSRFSSSPGHNIKDAQRYEDIAENLQVIIAKIQQAVKEESGTSIRSGRSTSTGSR